MKKENIKTEIIVKDNSIGIMRVGNIDYISLTDLAKFKNKDNPSNVIIHWLSNKDTAFYVGLWEELNNENFNFTEFREIKINEIGTSSYTMSPKQWIKRTNAIGITLPLEINIFLLSLINILVIQVLKNLGSLKFLILSYAFIIVSPIASPASSSFPNIEIAILNKYFLFSSISLLNASLFPLFASSSSDNFITSFFRSHTLDTLSHKKVHLNIKFFKKY